jgi:hypothetical protein
MSANNLEVIVQQPNKTTSRRQVGYISHGIKPEDHDYERWGVNQDSILSEGMRKVDKRQVYLIVAIGGAT